MKNKGVSELPFGMSREMFIGLLIFFLTVAIVLYWYYKMPWKVWLK